MREGEGGREGNYPNYIANKKCFILLIIFKQRVSYITSGSIISWRLVIEFTRSDYPGRTYNLYPTSAYSTSYTFRNIIAGVTINATIRVQGRYYCYTYLNGASSDNVVVTTIERRKL